MSLIFDVCFVSWHSISLSFFLVLKGVMLIMGLLGGNKRSADRKVAKSVNTSLKVSEDAKNVSDENKVVTGFSEVKPMVATGSSLDWNSGESVEEPEFDLKSYLVKYQDSFELPKDFDFDAPFYIFTDELKRKAVPIFGKYTDMCHFYYNILKQVNDKKGFTHIVTPVIPFTENAKNRCYDHMSDVEYQGLLGNLDALNKFWLGDKSIPLFGLLHSVFSGLSLSSEDLQSIAMILAKRSCELYDSNLLPDPAGFVDLGSFRSPVETGGGTIVAKVDGPEGVNEFNVIGSNARMSFKDALSPIEIEKRLNVWVYGQSDAKKAAAMFVYKHAVLKKRSNLLFYGPTGCGKTEIWRALKRCYPNVAIKIMDASMISANGWAGGLHVRDLFDGYEGGPLIIVLDEFDKLACEKAVGSTGTDHSALAQSNLLKMLDGDVLYFGDDGRMNFNSKSKSVDCSNISVVMCGSFDSLITKRSSKKQIGFVENVFGKTSNEINEDDLIKAGMRREIAGRIQRLVECDDLDVDGYTSILKDIVLLQYSREYKCNVVLSDDSISELVNKAIDAKLGVRWMKNRVETAMDYYIYDNFKDISSWKDDYKIELDKYLML